MMAYSARISLQSADSFHDTKDYLFYYNYLYFFVMAYSHWIPFQPTASFVNIIHVLDT